MTWSETRRCEMTAPPRWLMPCTSACLKRNPCQMAAMSMTNEIETIPCPPTPARMMLVSMVSLRRNQDRHFFAVTTHSRVGMMTERPS